MRPTNLSITAPLIATLLALSLACDERVLGPTPPAVRTTDDGAHRNIVDDARPSPRGGDSASADKPLEVRQEPLRIPVEIDARLRDRLGDLLANRDAKPSAVQLVIPDVQPPADAANVSIRVFVNTPDASVKTDVNAPGYVGSLSFFPRNADGAAPPAARHLLDLGPALRRLSANNPLDLTRPLQLTLVLTPTRGDTLPPNSTIRLARPTITVQ